MARPGRRQNGTHRIRHGAGLREKPHQRRAKAVALCMLRHCEKPGYHSLPKTGALDHRFVKRYLTAGNCRFTYVGGHSVVQKPRAEETLGTG
jgi:hypothetical protein